MTNFHLHAAYEAAKADANTATDASVAYAAYRAYADTKVNPRQSLLVRCEKFVARKLAAFNKRRLQLIIHTLNRPY